MRLDRQRPDTQTSLAHKTKPFRSTRGIHPGHRIRVIPATSLVFILTPPTAPTHKPVTIRKHRHMTLGTPQHVTCAMQCMIPDKNRFTMTHIQRVFHHPTVNPRWTGHRVTRCRIRNTRHAIVIKNKARKGQTRRWRQELRRMLATKFPLRIPHNPQRRRTITAGLPLLKRQIAAPQSPHNLLTRRGQRVKQQKGGTPAQGCQKTLFRHVHKIDVSPIPRKPVLGAILRRNTTPRIPGPQFITMHINPLNGGIPDRNRIAQKDTILVGQPQTPQIFRHRLIRHQQDGAIPEHPKIMLPRGGQRQHRGHRPHGGKSTITYPHLSGLAGPLRSCLFGNVFHMRPTQIGIIAKRTQKKTGRTTGHTMMHAGYTMFIQNRNPRPPGHRQQHLQRSVQIRLGPDPPQRRRHAMHRVDTGRAIPGHNR